MGYYGAQSRETVITEYMQPTIQANGVRTETLKHSRQGTNDWFLLRVMHPDGKTEITVLLNHWQHGSYKPMDESVGPYYYNMPISWLAKLTEPSNEWAAKWRESVRKFHAK